MNASAFTTEQTRMIDALKSTGADTDAIEKHFAELNQRLGDLAAPETLTAEEEAELRLAREAEERERAGAEVRVKLLRVSPRS